MAAAEQITAIQKIIDNDALDDLPSELKEIALLRLDNPEMTLSELGASLAVPISRSGVNHRLKKIIDTSRKLSDKPTE